MYILLSFAPFSTSFPSGFFSSFGLFGFVFYCFVMMDEGLDGRSAD